jgi:hypothetical protein
VQRLVFEALFGVPTLSDVPADGLVSTVRPSVSKMAVSVHCS